MASMKKGYYWNLTLPTWVGFGVLRNTQNYKPLSWPHLWFLNLGYWQLRCYLYTEPLC